MVEAVPTSLVLCLTRCPPPLPPLLQVTPFLLEAVRSATGGKSLKANIRLVKNNAAVGAQVAASLAALV